MSLSMSRTEREAFLAEIRVGVIGIERAGQAPLCVPIWYDYTPERGVWILTEPGSQKGRAIEKAGRFSLCAQNEQAPNYAYVSVEGPVAESWQADREKDARPMAQRYFGKELGDLYIESQSSGASHVYRMLPERWRTVDYRKLANA